MYNFHWIFKLVNTNGTAVSKDERVSFVYWTQMYGAVLRCVASCDPAGLLRLFSSPLWPVWKLNPRSERAGEGRYSDSSYWKSLGGSNPETTQNTSTSICLKTHARKKKKKNTNKSMPLYSLKTLEVKSISFLSFKWCGRRCPWVRLPWWWWSAGCDCKPGNWRASSATANQH